MSPFHVSFYFNVACQGFVILVIIAMLYLLIRLGNGARGREQAQPGGRLPGKAPRPGRWARYAEALALALVGGTILILCSGDHLLHLDDLSPAGFRQYFTVMAAVGLIIAGAVALAARTGRTGLAAFILAAALAWYGTYLNTGDKFRWAKSRPGMNLKPMNLNEMNRPTVDTVLEIHLMRVIAGCDFEFTGADLWLNGVRLGKTPVKISISELQRHVPRWDAPPPTLKEQPFKSVEATPWTLHHENCYRWIPHYLRDRSIGESGGDSIKYYVQAKLDGEQGFAKFFAYSVVGSEELLPVKVGVTFPQAEARLERLLAQARAKDYAVDDAWFKAMERYGDPVWEFLADLAQQEPGFAPILRQRTERLFGLDRLKTPEQNWTFLESTMKEADRVDAYDTDSTVGQAMALVAPHLDPDRLAALAEDLIPRYKMVAYSGKRIRGRFEFGSPRFSRQGSQQTVNGRGTEGWLRVLGWNESYPPPSAFVVAHAVWVAQQHLKAQAPNQPTPFETRVAMQLMRWYDVNQDYMRLAIALGGPEVDRFLMRKYQQTAANPDPRNHADQQMVGMGMQVNKWLYLAALRKDAYGRAFRAEPNVANSLMPIAGDVAKEGTSFFDDDLAGALFCDGALGTRSVGYQFWPRFRQFVRSRMWEELTMEMRYLVRLEPLATPQMYAEVWRDSRAKDHDHPTEGNPGSVIISELRPLAPARQAAALRAIIPEVERELAETADGERLSRDAGIKVRLALKRMKEQLLIVGDPQAMEKYLGELTPTTATVRREAAAAWLTQEHPEHPLAELLARASAPGLRQMALAPIVKCPTRERRALLAKLLTDPDPEVSQAAHAAQAELDQR